MPRTRNIIRGNTTADRFRSLENTLRAWEGRLSRTVIGIIPPIPILQSKRIPDDDGRIFAAISPLKGTLRTICFAVGAARNSQIAFDVRLTHKTTTVVKELICTQQTSSFEMELPLEVADVISIYVRDPQSVEDVLIGMLINASMESSQIEQQTLVRLLELSNESESKEA
jgi:hypothetical protein